MALLVNFVSPFVSFLRKIVNGVEFRKFKEAVRRNPQDHQLRARFAKYCLQFYFQNKTSKIHVVEAVNQFENIVHSDVLDLEMFYLMGKYYQGQDNAKAIEVYQKGVKRYNDYVSKSIDFRHDSVETVFLMAINLLSLEGNHADAELEKFFKTIRRTYLKNFLDQKMAFHPELVDKAPGDVSHATN